MSYMIDLTEDESDIILAAANRERRDPRDQIVVLALKALREETMVGDLLAALKSLTPFLPPRADGPCHAGITTQDECENCQRIIAAQAAITKAEGRE